MLNISVPERLSLLAGEAETLFALIGDQYADEETAGDRIAEFIIACNMAAIAYPQPDAMELKYSSLSPETIKSQKNRARNKRKAHKRARRLNR